MDFFTFKEFISIPVLIGFYYLGAFISPVFIWFFSIWMIKRFEFIDTVQAKGKEMTWRVLSAKQKLILMVIFVVMLLFMELLWRMLFEFLIAYMQIRDALVA